MVLQEQARDLINQNGIMKGLHSVTYYITVTGIYLKQMDLKHAFSSLQACEKEVENRGGQIKNSFIYNKIEYLFLSGDTAQAKKLLYQLMATESYWNLLSLSSLLKYLLPFGEMPVEMREMFLEAYDEAGQSKVTLNSQLLYGRIMLYQGNKQAALLLVDAALGQSRKTGTQLKTVEAILLKISILTKDKPERRTIVNLYKEAIYYAWENNIRLPFFYQKDIVLELHETCRDEITTGFSRVEKQFYDALISLCSEDAACSLSQREIEILGIMEKGYTNQEIADQLYISLSTVKTHIMNIYRKLEVNTRTGAIGKGKKKGLL